MKRKTTFIFSMVTIILGFMLAIQFQTTQKPIVRDTRDVWQLREDIEKEQKLQKEIVQEINQVEALLNEYNTVSEYEKVEALQEQKRVLSQRIGLTKVSGKGVVFKVDRLFDGLLGETSSNTIPPELLSRLINELNKNGAEAIAVADQRIISISPIRDVNGNTYVNNSQLPPLPIEIKVLSKNADKLHNRMAFSQSLDEFALENLELTSKVSEEITLPAYDQPLRIKYLESVDPKKS